MLLDANIVSEEISLTIRTGPNVDAMKILESNFDKKMSLYIGLDEKLDLSDQYDCFDSNFVVLINLSAEFSNFLSEKNVKSSKYINKILKLFSRAKKLDILKLTNLYLDEVPEEICKFENLTFLRLDRNNLSDFEVDSNCLPNLQELNINSNKRFTSISESILKLQSLHTFYAGFCSISKMPESIDKLKNLKILFLCGNPITTLPDNFSNIGELSSVALVGCSFEEFFINMISHPELESLHLHANTSLKCLKIVMPETSQKISHLNISKCPLVNVEVCVNLYNTITKTFGINDKELSEFDYVIKFDLNTLFKSSKFSSTSESKIFEYCFVNEFQGQSKTIRVRDFNPEIKQNLISQDDLIAKWTNICKKYNSLGEKTFQNEFEHSLTVLKKLYQTKINNCINGNDFVPFESKEKMIKILADLFDQLEKKNSESQVKKILKIFKEHYLEQLVYFNCLLKFSDTDSSKKIIFIDFIKETIVALRDDFIIYCLNKDEYEFEKADKAIHRIQCMRIEQASNQRYNYLPSIINDYNYELSNFFLRVIMKVKLRFDSGFTTGFISSIIYNVIQRIENQQLINNEMVKFLLNHCDCEDEYFEYVTQSSAVVISKVSAKGIESLVDLISNGYSSVDSSD